MVTYAAFDPGATTGWAIGTADDTKPLGLSLQQYGEVKDIKEDGLPLELLELIRDHGIKTVAIERFIARKRLGKGGIDVAKDVGWAINFQLHGTMNIRWQNASDAKGVITDERLKRAGLWIKGKPHTRDAIRHLIILLRKEAQQ